MDELFKVYWFCLDEFLTYCSFVLLDKNVLSVLQDSASFSMLIPMVCAYISPVVAADPSVTIALIPLSFPDCLLPVSY